jgi:hypothetical protein
MNAQLVLKEMQLTFHPPRDLHARKCACDARVTNGKAFVMSSTEKVFDGKL